MSIFDSVVNFAENQAQSFITKGANIIDQVGNLVANRFGYEVHVSKTINDITTHLFHHGIIENEISKDEPTQEKIQKLNYMVKADPNAYMKVAQRNPQAKSFLINLAYTHYQNTVKDILSGKNVPSLQLYKEYTLLQQLAGNDPKYQEWLQEINPIRLGRNLPITKGQLLAHAYLTGKGAYQTLSAISNGALWTALGGGLVSLATGILVPETDEITVPTALRLLGQSAEGLGTAIFGTSEFVKDVNSGVPLTDTLTDLTINLMGIKSLFDLPQDLRNAMTRQTIQSEDISQFFHKYDPLFTPKQLVNIKRARTGILESLQLSQKYPKLKALTSTILNTTDNIYKGMSFDTLQTIRQANSEREYLKDLTNRYDAYIKAFNDHGLLTGDGRELQSRLVELYNETPSTPLHTIVRNYVKETRYHRFSYITKRAKEKGAYELLITNPETDDALKLDLSNPVSENLNTLNTFLDKHSIINVLITDSNGDRYGMQSIYVPTGDNFFLHTGQVGYKGQVYDLDYATTPLSAPETFKENIAKRLEEILKADGQEITINPDELDVSKVETYVPKQSLFPFKVEREVAKLTNKLKKLRSRVSKNYEVLTTKPNKSIEKYAQTILRQANVHDEKLQARLTTLTDLLKQKPIENFTKAQRKVLKDTLKELGKIKDVSEPLQEKAKILDEFHTQLITNYMRSLKKASDFKSLKIGDKLEKIGSVHDEQLQKRIERLSNLLKQKPIQKFTKAQRKVLNDAIKELSKSTKASKPLHEKAKILDDFYKPLIENYIKKLRDNAKTRSKIKPLLDQEPVQNYTKAQRKVLNDAIAFIDKQSNSVDALKQKAKLLDEFKKPLITNYINSLKKASNLKSLKIGDKLKRIGSKHDEALQSKIEKLSDLLSQRPVQTFTKAQRKVLSEALASINKRAKAVEPLQEKAKLLDDFQKTLITKYLQQVRRVANMQSLKMYEKIFNSSVKFAEDYGNRLDNVFDKAVKSTDKAFDDFGAVLSKDLQKIKDAMYTESYNFQKIGKGFAVKFPDTKSQQDYMLKQFARQFYANTSAVRLLKELGEFTKLPAVAGKNPFIDALGQAIDDMFRTNEMPLEKATRIVGSLFTMFRPAITISNSAYVLSALHTIIPSLPVLARPVEFAKNLAQDYNRLLTHNGLFKANALNPLIPTLDSAMRSYVKGAIRSLNDTQKEQVAKELSIFMSDGSPEAQASFLHWLKTDPDALSDTIIDAVNGYNQWLVNPNLAKIINNPLAKSFLPWRNFITAPYSVAMHWFETAPKYFKDNPTRFLAKSLGISLLSAYAIGEGSVLPLAPVETPYAVFKQTMSLLAEVLGLHDQDLPDSPLTSLAQTMALHFASPEAVHDFFHEFGTFFIKHIVPISPNSHNIAVKGLATLLNVMQNLTTYGIASKSAGSVALEIPTPILQSILKLGNYLQLMHRGHTDYAKDEALSMLTENFEPLIKSLEGTVFGRELVRGMYNEPPELTISPAHVGLGALAGNLLAFYDGVIDNGEAYKLINLVKDAWDDKLGRNAEYPLTEDLGFFKRLTLRDYTVFQEPENINAILDKIALQNPSDYVPVFDRLLELASSTYEKAMKETTPSEFDRYYKAYLNFMQVLQTQQKHYEHTEYYQKLENVANSLLNELNQRKKQIGG